MAKDYKSAITLEWSRLLDAPVAAATSLQNTLKMNLAQAILDGRIPEGTRLPSTRQLASTIGVARVTVALAYEALEDQGLLVVRERSGHYVADGVRDHSAIQQPQPSELAGAPVWPSFLIQPQGTSVARTTVSPQKHRYSFIGGRVDRKLFPFAEWRECSRLAQSTHNSDHWTSDLSDKDDPFLLDQLISRVLARRGIFAKPEEILITMGSQMALYLLSETLVQPNATVALEDPGRPEARHLFARRGARLLPLTVDADGLVPPAELPKLSTVYTTPGHQVPSGVVLSQHRRHALLKLAHTHQALIIEDDSESALGFHEHPIPALKALDRSGHVIHVGSLSATLAPGLRMGYIVAHPHLIESMRLLRSLIAHHLPGNNQRTFALFVAHGHFERFLKQKRAALKQRAAQITMSLRQQLPHWRFEAPEGGSTIWVESAGEDVSAIKLQARKEGILIESGDEYFYTSQSHSKFALLNYATIEQSQIDSGIQALARIVARNGVESKAEPYVPGVEQAAQL